MSVAPTGPTKMPGVVGVPPLEPASEALPDELVAPDDGPVPLPLDEAWPPDDPAPELDVEVEPLLDEVPPADPELVVPPPLPPPPDEPEEDAVDDASSPVEAPFAPPPRSPPPPPVSGVELQEVRARASARAPEALTKANQRTRIMVIGERNVPLF